MYDLNELCCIKEVFGYNQKQHLFLGQRRIIENRMLIWLSSFIIKEDTGILQ